MTTASQNTRILKHLETGRSLSPLIALERYGCMRLAARIHDLRKKHRIESHRVKFGKRTWCSYMLDRA